jgi:GNAT superfamily N-acetyltransferase
MTISERVQASVRAANAAAREPVTAGAFTLYRHPASDHPYLNYAVPDAGATEWTGAPRSRTAVAEGVCELAGIGVRERFRRRGIAAALTAATAAEAFAAGAELCFLTPGDDGAERVYARAGFARAGTTMVHMVG